MIRFGKYRATVFDIKDPEKRGRIKVKCPSALGDATSTWCEVCVPVAIGNKNGDFYLPKEGETVWIEFEQGDVNKPIFVGNWWGDKELPTDELSGNTRIVSFNDNVITFNQATKIESKDKSKLFMKDYVEIESADGSIITITEDINIKAKSGEVVTLSGGRITINCGVYTQGLFVNGIPVSLQGHGH